MSYNRDYSGGGLSIPAIQASVEDRASFITKTYAHLLGAIIAFVLVEFFLFSSGLAENIARVMLQGSWLLVLGAFMVVSFIASRFAEKATSASAQYFGLGLYVVAQAIIFVPLLFIADMQFPGAIENAGIVTIIGFVALSMIVFISKKDFSFLGAVVKWGGFVALGAIVCSLLFNFSLGNFFPVIMVAFAGAAILYDTSNVLHKYPTNMHVSAALALFASVALLFWYVIQLFMNSDD